MSLILAQSHGQFFIRTPEIQYADIGESQVSAVVLQVDEVREELDRRVVAELEVGLDLAECFRRRVRTEREGNDVGVGGLVDAVGLDKYGGILCGGVDVEDIRYWNDGGFVEPRGDEKTGITEEHSRELFEFGTWNKHGMSSWNFKNIANLTKKSQVVTVTQ